MNTGFSWVEKAQDNEKREIFRAGLLKWKWTGITSRFLSNEETDRHDHWSPSWYVVQPRKISAPVRMSHEDVVLGEAIDKTTDLTH